MKVQLKMSKLQAQEKYLPYLDPLMEKWGVFLKTLLYEFSDANFGMLKPLNHKNKTTFILKTQKVFTIKVVLFLWFDALNMPKLASENSRLWAYGAPREFNLRPMLYNKNW